jgi:peptide/nickel transport system substrate-binding protein
MYNTTMSSPDPQLFMHQFVGSEIASKANKWAGRNVTRWRNEEYDRLWTAAESEMDPVKRAAMFVRMNDLVVQQVVAVPIVWRNRLQAVSNRLRGYEISGWDSGLAQLAFWYREG